MAESAKIIIDGKTHEFPVVVGTENEKAIDITNLRAQTGYITLDSGYGNTGACTSSITFLDGELGILRYRGYPVQDVAEHATFVETAYMLIYDKLPSKAELKSFSELFTKEAKLHPDMLNIIKGYPAKGHPMGALSATVCALSGFHPELTEPEPTPEALHRQYAQLLSKVRTLAAYNYKHSIGEEFIPPEDGYSYISNFLHMMFSTKKKLYQVKPSVEKAMRALLILHADHEQNCSTSTVRMVGSSWANLYASISAGVCALWGPLHGGANQEVVEMLQEIQDAGGDVDKFIARAKEPNTKARLMGFGHRVYKNFDPRATIIKKRCVDLFNELGVKDPLLEIALKLEQRALSDEYFVKRKLYPNVDFYSGLIYKAIGIPVAMFPVLFAIGRMPGWIAHWKEMKDNPKSRINRPRQIYIGEKERPFTPLDKR